jgi:hypothetical protein
MKDTEEMKHNSSVKREAVFDVLSVWHRGNMNAVWPPLDHTSSSFKQGLAGQMLFPLPQALERHSDGLSLHECATFARVAALDEKDIGRRWGFSHAHFAVYAPHQARVNRRSACHVESAGKRIPTATLECSHLFPIPFQ